MGGSAQVFDQALLHMAGEGEANTLLAKGITLHNLKRQGAAAEVFGILIHKFPHYRQKIASVFAQSRR